MLTSVRIIVRAVKQWFADGGTHHGAALAYYALFSIAPVLVIAIRIAGAVFGEKAAQGHVAGQLEIVFGPAGAAAVQGWLVNAHEHSHSQLVPIVGIGLLMFAALGMFLYVRSALCTIWKLTPPRGSTFLGVLWDYTLALTMVCFCAVLLLASLAASMAVSIHHDWLLELLPWLPWKLLEMVVSFVYLTILFASMYRILSGGRISWGYVVYGSFIAAVLFSFGKMLLGWYLVHTSTLSIYGAAGSVVVFLLWVYYSSQILFFGAELIQARRSRHEWLKAT
ncbi:MAG: YihY/virulence factor BrkB family protein [Gemmataceae bacterium]|nr:YihY/virulence factor BrkB family protein [Gemmataceae bacterium]